MTEPVRPSGAGGPRRPGFGLSGLVKGYGVLGLSVLLAFLAAGVFGWTWESDDRDVLPASVRQAPGGYRSYHLWHSGYQGGK